VNLRRALRDRQHARLLERARRGDGEAFRALYRELFAPVTGYLAPSDSIASIRRGAASWPGS